VASPADLGTVTIGLLMPPLEGEGSEFRDVAEGAAVAAYRFGLGGLTIRFAVALDNGTSAGAASALRSLLDNAEVAAVIVFSSGPHLDSAWDEAALSEVSVLVPYDRAATGHSSVWLTGPSRDEVDAQLATALAQGAVRSPFVVTSQVSGVTLGQAAQTVTWENPAAGADPIPTSCSGLVSATDCLADRAVQALQVGQADSVVIGAPASAQAQLAVALHNRLGQNQIPIFLSPESLTPTFGWGLTSSGATNGLYTTVGPDNGDYLAMAGSSGRYAATYFDALRLAAGSSSVRNVFGDESFATVAQSADIASHDAVVAVVRAAEAAGSTFAPAVREVLGGLGLDGGDGLAGAALDFRHETALPADGVVTLHASTSNPGLRPPPANPTGAPALFWFAVR